MVYVEIVDMMWMIANMRSFENIPEGKETVGSY